MLGMAEADSLELHSIMVLKDGYVIYENWMGAGHADSLHILNSVSKTYTSLAIGMAIEEGKLKLDDKLVSFFPTNFLISCPAISRQSLCATSSP